MAPQVPSLPFFGVNFVVEVLFFRGFVGIIRKGREEEGNDEKLRGKNNFNKKIGSNLSLTIFLIFLP